MSLINDALKKAQTLQTRPAGQNTNFPRANPSGEPAAAAGSGTNPLDPLAGPKLTPPTLTPRPRTKSSQAGVVIAIASVVLIVGLGAIGYVVYALFFAPTPADQLEQAAQPTPAVAAQPAPAEPAPAPAATPAAPAATPEVATVTTTPPAPAPATPAASNAPAPAATIPAANPAPVAEVAPEPAYVPPPEPEVVEHYNNPDPKISAWVSTITVTGIRGGEKPKALMNDRVFLVGDIVNHDFALRLSKIDTRVLTFEDAEGNTYEYNF